MPSTEHRLLQSFGGQRSGFDAQGLGLLGVHHEFFHSRFAFGGNHE